MARLIKRCFSKVQGIDIINGTGIESMTHTRWLRLIDIFSPATSLDHVHVLILFDKKHKTNINDDINVSTVKYLN